ERLLMDPQQGAVIEGTGGARKIRIKLDCNHGKSSGGRVVYLDVFELCKLYLLFAYPKNVQEDLTPEQKRRIKLLVETIKRRKL
ncbi:MAG: addiction module toxin RelE, partial [Clostridiales bacterium]|nr:addiction module toxin RelE [Clostridiales bacterium]